MYMHKYGKMRKYNAFNVNIYFSFILGAGTYAGCMYCCMAGEYSKALKKMVYLNHRSFLPSIDCLRSDHTSFPSATIRPLPIPKTMKYIDEANAEYVVTPNKDKKVLCKKKGCKGPYSLRRLPFHDRYMNTPVEPMHLIKNIAEHIVKMVLGISDSAEVRKEEEHRKRFRDSWVKESKDGEETRIPPAPFCLQKDEKIIANCTY